MPPRAASRLSVIVLSPGGPPPEVVLERLGEQPLFDGGERLCRAEISPRGRFFSSGQGGFRVSCPVDGRVITSAFVPALEGWRRGGCREIQCPCGLRHDLDALDYTPPAGFAAAWIEARDVGSVELSAPAAAILREMWPDCRLVGQRG